MTQLSKEYFDQHIKGLATKADLKPLVTEDTLSTQLKSLVTKDELSSRLTDQTRQLKEYTDTQVSDLRTEIQEGFDGVDKKLDALRELLDVRQRVERLEQQVAKLQTRG